MREIIFRAKRVDNGEWVEGFYFCMVHDDGSHVHHFIMPLGVDLSFGTPIEKIQVEIDANTICQYTGLTDKNGNKVWENDIIKHHFGNEVAPIRFAVYQSCFDNTKTGHTGFYVDWNGKSALRKDLGYWVNMIDCNVIGNIIDNPELIRV